MRRFLTGLVLAPSSVAVILWAPPALATAVVALIALFCYREYLGIAAACGAGPFGVWTYAAGLAVLLAPRDGWLILVAIALAAIALELANGDFAHSLPRSSSVVLGILYIFGAWKCGLFIFDHSRYWLLFALAINWTGDVSAYYVGRAIGIHKLAPKVSPGKSWEGAVASVLTSVGFGIWFLGRFLPGVPLIEGVILSVLVNAAGQIGDLAESAMKRGAGIKDSSTVLPGHGGVLDRLDSSLFTMPAVYAYLTTRLT